MFRRFTLLFPCIFFLIFNLQAQKIPTKFWVQFTDKNNSPYSLSNPSEYLSQKAIDRRNRQNIQIQENDLPINPWYIDSILSTGVSLLNKSKWFNAITIYVEDTNILQQIQTFPFVAQIEPVYFAFVGKTQKDFFQNEVITNSELRIINYEYPTSNIQHSTSNILYNYGYAFNQINMIETDELHKLGYRGEGMTIAVLDAGFYRVDSLSAFDSLWANNQILGVKDFVNHSEGGANVFDESTHGMYVLSIIGGNIWGQFVGAAPRANFWLLRTEDVESEYRIEEDNWISAAEFADSVGADIINSSLGYSIFDTTLHNYSYADMNGNTTRVTRGADIAASKGILVVNSAGNSGDDPWQYIIAPSDGDSVLCVGAVDSYRNYVSFSSTGPSSDGRIKPNICAQGRKTAIWHETEQVVQGSGTSFSSPLIAGSAACLWQANPHLTNMQILHLIEQSSDQFNYPDSLKGFGIPNFYVAYLLAQNKAIADFYDNFIVYPNPFKDIINISYFSNYDISTAIEIIDITGKRVYLENITLPETTPDAADIISVDLIYPYLDFKYTYYKNIRIDNLRDFSQGMYFLTIITPEKKYVRKIIKY